MAKNPYEHEPPVSTGIYFKFEDKHDHRIRLASDPVIYTSTFMDNSREMYAWVIWNIELEQAQVIQLPVTVYRMIKAFAMDEDYGDPKEYSFKIKRSGQKFDTKYEVMPSPKRIPLSEIHPDAVEQVAKIDLIDKISKGNGNSNVEWLADVDERPALEQPTSEADEAFFNDATVAPAEDVKSNEESDADAEW